ncbi:MAG: hypothetical protein F4Y69_03720 [Chloroflexi bacterium]|nr:hypothetical protein [Chloroflexota bacterium]MYF22440.1 hypothetical protein [Chloroflexota bacterium]
MLIVSRRHTGARQSRLARALSVTWLGQTVASLCWMGSMLVYGIETGGDWLQLCAASAWLLANLAALARGNDD